MAFIPITPTQYDAIADLAATPIGRVLFGNATSNGPENDSLLFWDNTTKHLGVGVGAPTATLHLPGTTAAAGTASLKIDAGVLLAVAENGAIESDGTNLYWTNGSGTRQQLNNSTLAGAYATGTVAADQTLALLDANGGRFIVDGSAAGFTTLVSMQVKGDYLQTGLARTGLAAGTEVIGSNFNFAVTKQWAAGALATQREVVFQAPTYAFVSASTITTAATVAITGAPGVGANAAITNPLSLWSQAGAVRFTGGTYTNTSGTKRQLEASATFNVASGSAKFQPLYLSYTLNQTGSSSGEVIGFYIDVTQTSVRGVHNLVRVDTNTNTVFKITEIGGVAVSQVAMTGSLVYPHAALEIIAGAHVGIDAVETPGVDFNLAVTKNFVAGNIATQREFVVRAPTYSFAGASTITTTATVAITGAPIKGGNATLTNTSALLLQGTYSPSTANMAINEMAVVATFSPTASTSTFNAINASYTINQTGGASGTVTGIRLNATETAVVGTHNLLNLMIASADRFTVNRRGGLTITQGVVDSSATFTTALTITGAAHTSLPLSTEVIGVNVNQSATKQWATGALATQREVVIQAPTYSFVGASTVTTAATFAVTGAPTAGLNATITTPLALWVQNGSSQFIGTQTITTAAGAKLNIVDLGSATVTLSGAGTVTALTALNVVGPSVTSASAAVTTDFYTARLGIATFGGAGPASATRNWSLYAEGNVRLAGAQTVKGTDVNAAGPYVVTETDYILEVRYTSTGTIQVTLPALTGGSQLNGRIIIIKDSGYSAAINNITVAVGNAADQIENGGAGVSYTINTIGFCLWLKANTTTNNWEII